MKTEVYSFTTIEELQNIDTSLDSSKTLIQVFCAVINKNYIQQIQKTINLNFPKSSLIGATSDGTIVRGNYYDNKSIIVITKFAKTLFKAYSFDFSISQDYYQIGQLVAQNIKTKDTKAIITFADGIHINGEEYLKGIASGAKKIIISGGMAADNGKMQETFVFNNTMLSSNGVVAISLNARELYASNGFSFDWMPIGKEMVITKSIENRLYEINGQNVIDIYAKYLGNDIAKQLPRTGIEFPLVFKKDGVYIGRAVISKCDDGSLVYAGNIPEGTEVRFGVGNISLIKRDASHSIESNLKSYQYQPESIFIYSCMARKRLLGNQVIHELKILENIAVSGGFFTYGEFYKNSKNTEFLNETLTFLMLAEDNTKEISSHIDTSNDIIDEMNTIHALANLANVVSQELEELNKNLLKKVQESTQEIYKQAYYDKLTKLPNRLNLIKRLQNSVDDVIFLINIDDFTSINDFYGHAIGDKVLQKLAEIFQQFIQEEKGELFKLPSDEFVILLKIPYKYSLIEEKIHRLIFMVEKYQFIIDDIRIYLQIAVATALTRGDGLGLANADISLKMAKKSSKAYMIYNNDANILKKYEENLNMVNLLKEAINNDKAVPYYQPIFDAKTKKVVKYEALIRLQKARDETLVPYSFLKISQKIRLYHHITKIMIDKTCEFFSKNKHDFSINLAFEDILNHSTREYFINKVKQTGVAKQLTIEILETTELTDEEEVLDYLQVFSDLGIKIAIDDFGSGFANFEYLTKINVSYIKLDGSIIKNIDKDKNARIIVETIISFAKKMEIQTVAEYVHSQEVFNVVRELGVDYVQGFFLAQPSAEII